jgi:hypothetical protein
MGIGQIDGDGRNCQLEQNLSASQIRAESLSQTDRVEIERMAREARDVQTNWFQEPWRPLGAPREAALAVEKLDGKRAVQLSWHSAYAADDPIERYEIRRDDRPIGQVEHRPQATLTPFVFDDVSEAGAGHAYQIITVDRAGRRAASESLESASV